MDYDISETPERYIILKLPDNLYKVYATWAGGYLGADRWKLNSGIEKVEEDDDYYYFIGFSGSCYKCYKKAYGTITAYGLANLNRILELGKGKIKAMEDVPDWNSIKLN